MEHIEAFDKGLWNALLSVRMTFPFIDPILLKLSLLDNLWLLLILTVIFVLVAMKREKRGTAIFVLAAFVGAGVLAWGTQTLVGRERPTGVITWYEPPPTQWSFPNEYTLLMTATYLALMISLVDWFPQYRILIRTVGITLVFLLGWSRMFIGACFPTDVVGGWLAGIGWVLLCRWVQERWSKAAPVGETSPAISS